MKNIFLIALLLISFGFYAQGQRGGNGGGRSQQNQNRQGGNQREVKEFKASDVAGIFYYDIEKALKKIKVKDDILKAKVSKSIGNYNDKIRKISFLNSKMLSDLNLIVNQSSKGNDNEGKRELRKKVNKAIRPIKEIIQENEKELNQNLESILSEKQLKKWLKFQKKKKEALQPKKRERENRRGSKPNGGRNRRQ